MTAATDVDLLVRGDFLYPMAGNARVVRGAEVAVVADRVAYAGPAKPAGSWRARTNIDGAGKAILPGFVNCHSHAASAVFRSQSDDGAGGGALYSVAFRAEKDITPEQWRDLAGLGVLDMIKAGITTINDIWYEPEALAETCIAAGLRADIAYKVFDVRLEDLHHGDYTRHPGIGAERLARGVRFVDDWHGAGDGLIRGRMGPHASDTCAPGLLSEMAAEARRRAVGLHIHVAQSQREADFNQHHYGMGPAAHLAKLRVLGPDAVLAHLTFASPADLDAVRDAGACYAHCATIYPRRGVYPDVAAIQARGIVHGLATDWMQNDPFEAMRNLVNALRLRTGRVDAMSTAEALRLATVGGADVLGRPDLGRLRPGSKADLIQVDLAQPHIAPFYADAASLVYYARANDVVTSVIDGRVVMRDRQVLTVDEPALLAAVRRHLPAWSDLLRGLGGVSHLPGCCD